MKSTSTSKDFSHIAVYRGASSRGAMMATFEEMKRSHAEAQSSQS